MKEKPVDYQDYLKAKIAFDKNEREFTKLEEFMFMHIDNLDRTISSISERSDILENKLLIEKEKTEFIREFSLAMAGKY